MAKYMLKRLGQTLLIVVLVSFLTFLLVSLMPKDPVYSLYGTDLTAEEYQARFVEMGLDKPVLVRYFTWAKGANGRTACSRCWPTSSAVSPPSLWQW